MSSPATGPAEPSPTGFAPEVIRLFERLKRDAEAGGYHLNPDQDLTLRLVEGLHKNQQRHGYLMCPCRLAFGEKAKDLDLICPCDYRDQDLNDYGACYCGLYVSQAYLAGTRKPQVVPERRPMEFTRHGFVPPAGQPDAPQDRSTTIPVWRCRVCGYLCAREQPPEVCPVCKARRDRFEIFPLAG